MTRIRRSADHAAPRRTRARAAFTLVALLAIFLQAFLVQTHIHASPVFAPAYERGAHDVASHDGAHVSATHDQQGCIICQALAANGGATLTDPAHVAATTNASYETAALEIRRAPRAVTHSWRSRAPPIAA